MTLISQFKSTFTSDCKAMSYVPACWLPYFIFEHLTRRIKRPSQSPASCLPNIQMPWHAEGPFRFPPHQNEQRPPIFPISFWLTYILSHKPAWLTRLSDRSVGLACSLHSPLGFPQPSNWIPCVCGRMAATSDKTVGESLSSLSFLEVDLKEGLCWYLQW